MNAKQRNNADAKATRLREIKAQIKELTVEKDALETYLLSVLPEGEATELSANIITIQVRKMIDAEKIEAAFPVESHPDYYKLAVDTQAVKHHIAPSDLAPYQKTSSSVIVKEA